MPSAELVIFLAYLPAGPGFWLLYALGMRAGLRRLNLLDRATTPPPPTSSQRVLIVIPARNEARNINACVTSALAQQNVDLRVLAIDDRSDDGTAEILRTLESTDPRLEVVSLRGEVPAGWTGKCAAIDRGLRHAREDAAVDWLLFLDSDVVLAPNAMDAALRLALRGREGDDPTGHGLVSLLLRQECRSTWERLLVPLSSAVVVACWGVGYANNDRFKNHAFACGQFMLFRRDLYETLGGHAAVRGELSEDVELARLAKLAGARPRVAHAAGYGFVRQHEGLLTLISQWGRNFYGDPRGRVTSLLPAVAVTLFCGASAYAAAMWAGWRWWAGVAGQGSNDWRMEAASWTLATGLHLILMTLMLARTYRAQNLPGKTALLAPVGGTLLLAALARGVWMWITGNVRWRGRTFRAEPPRLSMTPAARR